MINDTLKITPGEKLGGVTLGDSLVTPIPKPTPPKKRSKKHAGYIRGKKVNGGTYYYYCWIERNAAGEYPEKSEYLGTAEYIRQKVKGQ